MYDPEMVAPMRSELTKVGFVELRTAAEVEARLGNHSGTSLVMVNSVCGCAAGSARPGVAQAVKNSVLPKDLFTVFAGQDREATDRARSYFHGYSPSSPSIALLKDGEVVHMMERMDIEGRSADEIAAELKGAFNRHCVEWGAATTTASLLGQFPAHAKKLSALFGSKKSLGEGCSEAGVRKMIEDIEDILDAEPELLPVSFTPEGAQGFKKLREENKQPNSGLALTQHGLDFREQAGPNDLEFESEGLKIFVGRDMAKRYSGRKVHFQSGGERGGGFAII